MKNCFSVLMALSVLIFLVLSGAIVMFEIPFWIAFGWIAFLIRAVPQLSINLGEIAVGVISFAAFAILLHGLVRSFSVQREPLPWKSRHSQSNWTIIKSLAVCTLVCSLFFAGISFVGIVHQSIWLTQSEIGRSDFQTAVYRIESGNTVRQFAIASHNFFDAESTLPAGSLRGPNGQLAGGWLSQLLPFLELNALAEKIDPNVAWNHPNNATAYSTPVDFFVIGNGNPSMNREMKGYARTDYASNQYVVGPHMPLKLDAISDGTSNTILFGEAVANPLPWGHPANWRDPGIGLNQSRSGFSSPGRPNVVFAFCDGSVRTIPEDVDPELLKSFSTPDGAESESDFDY